MMLSFRLSQRLFTRTSALVRLSTTTKTRGDIPSVKVPSSAATTTTTIQDEASATVAIPLISTSTHLKNGGLAFLLLSFCGGVAYYSMQAVGQAAAGGSGSTIEDNNTNDPIATLRKEAAVAREKHNQQEQQTQESQDMLKKF